MAKYILKRCLWLIPITLLVIIFVFTILYFIPGDTARAVKGQHASEEIIAKFNAEHGLDQGYFGRLFKYIIGLFKGDMGRSYYSNVAVLPQILARLPYTMLVATLATMFGVIVGLPIGILAATHQNTWLDSVTMAVTMFFTSMPSFWFAMILISIFSLSLHWLPSVGYQSWKNYIMPVITIGLHISAVMARQSRSSMLEVIRSDYITTARAKGQKEKKVIFSHVLRNGSIPVVTVAGGTFAAMMGGALIVETLFSIPGIGTYLFGGIATADVPIVLGCVTVIALFHGVIMIIVDILYTVVDPRLKARFVQAR
ncbi:MAG: ABC transporter permease, partial [Clostridia bacterium]|nr:ABC transporter permease [Clostridia bacterium]